MLRGDDRELHQVGPLAEEHPSSAGGCVRFRESAAMMMMMSRAKLLLLLLLSLSVCTHIAREGVTLCCVCPLNLNVLG